MEARPSEVPAASTFFYGPPDRPPRKVGRPQSHHQDPNPYLGLRAQDMRAAVDEMRAARAQKDEKGERTKKRSTRSFAIFLAMAAVLATVATSAAVAGSCVHGNNPHCAGSSGGGGGGGGGGGSLTLVMANDANGDGLPNFGDTVTFNVSTTVTSYPYVSLQCSQGGVQVYSAWAGFYPDFPWPWQQDFTLKSPAWTGGAASCTAILYYNNGRTWATIMSQGFQVYA